MTAQDDDFVLVLVLGSASRRLGASIAHYFGRELGAAETLQSQTATFLCGCSKMCGA